MKINIIMPNFLIIGAAKSGTTALYAYLKQHPDIYMSPCKEPRFFAFEGESLNFQGPGTEMNQTTITDIETYRNLFKEVKHETAIGEASPAYMPVPKAAVRIQHYIPNVKLIAILRNPVDRAFSSFLHLVRDGHEKLDFSKSLEQEEKRIDNNWGFLWHYKKLGFYYAQLKNYFDIFKREQIRIYLHEDLTTEPLDLMQEIFRFLNVDDEFIPNMSTKPNESGVPKSRMLQSFLNKPDPIKSFFKPLFPEPLRKSLVNTLKTKNLSKPELLPEVRQQLTQEYRQDILKLQDLIKRDLSSWLA